MKNINPETSKRFLHSPKVMDNIDSPEVRAASPDIVDVATRPVDIDSDRLGGGITRTGWRSKASV
jgi:hypothetical protein